MRIDPDELQPPNEPYRGILPFRLLDWRIFLERDVEAERLGNLVSMYSGVLLYGQSGAGKSSLVNAGLIPHALRQGRAPERIRVFPKQCRELFVERIQLQEGEKEGVAPKNKLPRYLPSRFTSSDNDERVALSCEKFLETLHMSSRPGSELGVPLLIFDQFEELVTLFEESPKDAERFREAREARLAIDQLLCELLLNDPLPFKIVFAFRDDYLARLTPLFSRIPNLVDQGVRLDPPRVERLKTIVRGPFVKSEDDQRGLPGHFKNESSKQPDELSEELADKIAAGIAERRPSGILNLSEVQTLCLAFWQQPKRREELLRADDPAVVLEQIIESEAVNALSKLFLWDRVPALALLANLVTQEGTRDVVSEENLIDETRRNPLTWVFRGDLRKLLKEMPEKTGLLRRSESSGTTYYELASEFLISWIQKQQKKFKKLFLVVWAWAFAGLVSLLFLIGWFAHKAEDATKQVTRSLDETQKAKDAALRALDKLKQANDKIEIAARRAAHARDEAEKLIDFMIKDLADKLESRDDMFLLEKIARRIEAHYKALTEEDQGPEMLRHWKSVVLDNEGHRFEKNGHLKEALGRFQDSLKIREELASQDVNNARWQRDLAESYNEIGKVFYAQGNVPNTLTNFQKGLEIAKKLAMQDPNPDWERLLVDCFNEIGEVQQYQGDFGNALLNFQEAFKIADKHARQEPDNTDWQDELASSLSYVGRVLLYDGKPEEAFEKFRTSFEICEKLTRQDPQNTVWRTGLAAAYVNIGDALLANKDPKGSMQNYHDALFELDKVAKQNPESLGSQEQHALALKRVGDALSEKHDWVGAEKNYRSSIATFEKLTERDPANAAWQAILADTYVALSDILSARGQFVKARKPAEDGVAIMEKLTDRYRTNASWQKTLAVNYVILGHILSNIEPRSKEARMRLQKGHEILLEFKQLTGLIASEQEWLDLAEHDLDEMDKKK